jgi:multidrug efflux pump subunit AcrA (membrane-fusion protein)
VKAEAIESIVIGIVPESRFNVVLARLLTTAAAVVVGALVLVPWVQTAPGDGRVIAYAPDERQQTIDAPVDGRITRWYVSEGQEVKEGEPIVDITDNDPEILARLNQERDAVRARITAARARVDAISMRMDALTDAQKAAVMAAGQRVSMAEQRLRAAERAKEAALAAAKAAQLNYDRQKALVDQGLSSQRALEVAEAERVRSDTDVDRAEANLLAARQEIDALGSDRTRVESDTAASFRDALATRAMSEAEIANGLAELARLEVRISRQETQHVRAPADGMVLRVLARQGAEFVKSGDVLAQFVPHTAERAVEMWVSGNDVNLISPGRDVRLQFEGWPAIQFSGWPTAAVGTYGGRVAFVDSAADANGKFRVVVSPYPADAWPEAQFLRQGMKAKGWVLLDTVRAGYEIWRQINGFPPEWTHDADAGAKGDGKKEKK